MIPHHLHPSEQSAAACARPAADGLSLFEIAISLALVTISVLSVLLLLPTGVKAQELARLELFAAAKAMERVEVFNQGVNGSVQGENEAPCAWDVPVSRRIDAPDLECRLSTHKYGVFPLPPRIAQRLDSDQHEIETILAEGGQLYFSKPSAITGLDEAFSDAPPVNLAQRLVFAV